MSRPPLARLLQVTSFAALALAASGCPRPTLGAIELNIVFINETQTRCVIVWAATANSSRVRTAPIVRDDATMVVGISETAELTGEVTVGVERYESPACDGQPFATPTLTSTLTRSQRHVLNMDIHGPEEFADGGEDGGVDGGQDGGCLPSQCTTPPNDCFSSSGTCGANGCEYAARAGGAVCDGGVCNGAGACGPNICAYADAGAPCDDGLSCTTAQCNLSRSCESSCPNLPSTTCLLRANPLMCGGDGGCLYNPANPNGVCNLDGNGDAGRCNEGACQTWFPFSPSNMPDDVRTFQSKPPPWVAQNNAIDGGPCVMDTDAPGPGDGGCGFTGLAVAVSVDGGQEVAIFPAASLQVPPTVEVRFVGSRPAIIAVLGDATVDGRLLAAARSNEEPAAGAGNGLGCSGPQDGGAGGSYQTLGGSAGSTPAGAQNGLEPNVSLRGGCAGGRGADGGGLGGAGGGALQLTVAGRLDVRDGGVLSVSGEGGKGGSPGGGGGSGGTLWLEAREVYLNHCALTANGGGGGGPTDPGTDGLLDSNSRASGGAGGGGDGASSTSTSGRNGNSSSGGGGGLGLLKVVNLRSCDSAVVVSAHASYSGGMGGTVCQQ